ncbi:hypothetical protein [Paenibacillus aestuarii]|uniref:LPXTG cell wall anchor domain-containing protein n=1 Tax=Paenibacillus aestuarii TaxID=516965 RepID=A0ABW0K9B3_9BACL|nr:hypothetical protein [Paenibacillus aestuarii]
MRIRSEKRWIKRWIIAALIVAVIGIGAGVAAKEMGGSRYEQAFQHARQAVGSYTGLILTEKENQHQTLERPGSSHERGGRHEGGGFGGHDMAGAGVAAAGVVLGGAALYWVWKRRKKAIGVTAVQGANMASAAALLPSTADYLDQWEQQHTTNTKGVE